MIRAAKYILGAFAALVVIAIASPLLAVLGRTTRAQRGELVVDPDLLGPDDPGVDIDEDERYP